MKKLRAANKRLMAEKQALQREREILLNEYIRGSRRSPQWTNEEADKVFKQMIAKWHPDRNQSPVATEVSQDLNRLRDVYSGKNGKR